MAADQVFLVIEQTTWFHYSLHSSGKKQATNILRDLTALTQELGDDSSVDIAAAGSQI